LSAVDSRNKNRIIFYVDGSNNLGFSGGPIVVKHADSGEFHVFGVIKGYAAEGLSVVKKADFDNQEATAYKDLYVRGNTGIVMGHSIRHILDVIQGEKCTAEKK
jgi:hypothetical protein